MWQWFDDRAAEVERQTPDERIRYADFLRVLAIGLVVLGHWLAPHISLVNDVFRVRLVHAAVEDAQWLTWLFQIMPVFFFVGGLANAIGWASATERGESYVDWLRKRARRLLRPLIPLLVVWVPLALVLDTAGVPTYLVTRASHAVVFPVWFLAAYLCVVALSPAAYWLHRRIGAAALLGLMALAVAADVLTRLGVDWVVWLNFIFVWGAIHQAGFFWYDRRFPRRAMWGVVLAIAALALLWVLTHVLNYPLSMVGTGFERHPNDLPPSVALVVLASAQIGIFLALRKPVNRWLKKPRVWTVVTLLGQRIMTIYLWHMTALVVVALLVYPTGLWPDIEQVDRSWWLWRIPWVLLLAAVLVALVASFGRFEARLAWSPTSHRGWLVAIKALVAVVLTALGIAMVMVDGLYHGGGLAGVSWVPIGVLALGLWGLGVATRSP